jgi:single-stranded-DNA-specific exonuclease
VADIVPLIDENRIFVKYGLAQLCRTKNHGLAALLQSTKLNEKRITPFHIGFMLGPRINASGRMDSAHTSLDLFLSRSRSEADALAAELEQHNQDRQRMQREVVQEAIEIVEQEINFNKEKVIVLSKNGWHKGILGIVASKLTDRYYRPTVVISIKDGIGVASARSVEGFHLHNVLQTCAHHLEAFGGHEGAAGLTIREENIDPFRTMINKVAAEIMEEQEILPVIDIDAEMPLAMVDMNFVRMIEAMEPFGEGNPLPILCSRGLTVRGAPRVMAKDTLKFWVTDGKVCISAVGFGMGSYEPIVRQGKKLDLAYEVSIDDWNKEPTVQLMLKDIKVSE